MDLRRWFGLIILISVLFAAFIILHLLNSIMEGERIDVLLKSDFSSSGYLYLKHNASIVNGVLRLNVTDVDGKWSYSKAMRGVMPHGWDRYETIREVSFNGKSETCENFMFLRIIARRTPNVQFYNKSESWVNFFVTFWFMIDEKTFNEPWSRQLCFDIRLFSIQYKGGEPKYVLEDIAFTGHALGIDNDYHYITSDGKLFLEEPNKWYDITIDAGRLINRALKYFNIERAVLKEIEIVLEANYGHAETEIDYIEVYVKTRA